MSTESLQAYKYAAEVSTFLWNINRLYGKAGQVKPNAETALLSLPIHAKLGVSVAIAMVKSRDSETVYWETIDALGRFRTKPSVTPSPCRSSAKVLGNLTPS